MRAFEILLIEDTQDYIRLTERALKEIKVPGNLSIVKDGVEALDFLHHRNKYTHAPRPDIILLDMNLLKKSGKEVLAEIKNDTDLKRIPVVVLITSDSKQDILECYNLYANCCILVNPERFITVIKSISDFWFTVAKLPPGD